MVVRRRTTLAKLFLAGLIAAPWSTAAPAVSGLAASLDPPEPPDATITHLPPVREEHGPLLADDFLAGTDAAPRWSARLGAVILQRARPRSELFLYEVGTGTPLLNPADLVFPFRGGVDVGLLRQGTLADLEFRYFGVEHWTAADGPVESATGMQLNIPGVDPYAGPVAAKLNATTSLQSFEVNLRRNVGPRWSWLAGFRYIAFRDALRLTAGEPTFTDYGTVLFGTANNLFGLQIGGEGILWQPGPRFHVDGAIKAGVYADGAKSSITGYATNDPDTIDFRTGRDNTAFVGDLSFVGVYRLSDRWALRAGYQLLWLSGVAAGSMQFHDIDLATPEFKTNTSATVFFHGALVGAERTW